MCAAIGPDRDRLVRDLGKCRCRRASRPSPAWCWGATIAEHESVDLVLAEALDHLQPGAARRARRSTSTAPATSILPTPTCGPPGTDDRVVLGAEWNDRLIGLDDAAQRLAPLGLTHGPAQLGAQHPGGPVRAEAELALQLQGRDCRWSASPSETRPRTTLVNGQLCWRA